MENNFLAMDESPDQDKSRMRWTEEEDRLLVKLVESYGEKQWSNIATMFVGRIGKQCRERWNNHLHPGIKKNEWTEEEERILIEAHMEVGNKWTEISKRIPGRTENSIKNHWNTAKRSKRRKLKAGVDVRPTSILQDYIRRSSKVMIQKGRERQSQESNDNPLPTINPSPVEEDMHGMEGNHDIFEDIDFSSIFSWPTSSSSPTFDFDFGSVLEDPNIGFGSQDFPNEFAK